MYVFTYMLLSELLLPVGRLPCIYIQFMYVQRCCIHIYKYIYVYPIIRIASIAGGPSTMYINTHYMCTYMQYTYMYLCL